MVWTQHPRNPRKEHGEAGVQRGLWPRRAGHRGEAGARLTAPPAAGPGLHSEDVPGGARPAPGPRPFPFRSQPPLRHGKPWICGLRAGTASSLRSSTAVGLGAGALEPTGAGGSWSQRRQRGSPGIPARRAAHRLPAEPSSGRGCSRSSRGSKVTVALQSCSWGRGPCAGICPFSGRRGSRAESRGGAGGAPSPPRAPPTVPPLPRTPCRC